MRRGPKDRYRFSHQGKLTWLILGAVAPAVIIVMLILWFGDFSAKVQWTLAIVILTFAAGFISAARDHVVHPLQTMSNLLAALREGDYSIRARGARADDALGEVLLEVNTLGETLRVQRLGAFEATALLRTIMAEIDVAVFTFDPDRRLRLVNRTGENLLGQPMDKLLGRSAEDLGLEACYDVDRGARGFTGPVHAGLHASGQAAAATKGRCRSWRADPARGESGAAIECTDRARAEIKNLCRRGPDRTSVD